MFRRYHAPLRSCKALRERLASRHYARPQSPQSRSHVSTAASKPCPQPFELRPVTGQKTELTHNQQRRRGLPAERTQASLSQAEKLTCGRNGSEHSVMPGEPKSPFGRRARPRIDCTQPELSAG